MWKEWRLGSQLPTFLPKVYATGIGHRCLGLKGCTSIYKDSAIQITIYKGIVMFIPMPSPNKTNKARLFVPASRFGPVAAYDSKRGLGRDEDYLEEEPDAAAH